MEKRARTAAKTRLTISANKIRDINESEITVTELEHLICDFEQKLNVFDSAQLEVEQTLDEDDLETEIQQSEQFRDEKVRFLIKAKQLLETKSTPKELIETELSTHRPRSSSRSNIHSNLHQAKLPQIELQKFSGEHTQWQSFWDKFTAIVHESDLPSVSKFTYLQSLLRGEALAAICGLALTEANYETARDLLQKRFGRKERIVSSHVQELLNLSNPGKSTSDLWSLYDKLQTHIRSLENLNITGETYGVILTPLVLFKLPENIRLEWARNSEGKESNLEALLDFLHNEILRRERSQTFRPDHQAVKTDRKSGFNRTSTAAALHASGKGNKVNITCHICSKSHNTEKCFSWNKLDLEGRKTQCFEKGLCFLCFGLHRIKDCKSKSRCNCSGKHHPLLCNKLHVIDDSLEDRTPPPGQNVVSQSLQVHTKTEKNRHAMLQIAQAKVWDINKRQSVSVNLLFDGGSDRSYISSSCVKTLGLKVDSKENVSVSIFGQGKPNTPKLRNKYKVTLITKGHEEIQMAVTETPVICSPIYKHRVPDEYTEKLKEMHLINKLAKGSLVDSDCHLNVDILVGMDYFWQLVMPNICQVTEYLSAQETKFGWIISGSWEIETRQKGGSSHQLLCMTDIPDHFGNQFWDLDVIGIQENGTKSEDINQTDQRVVEYFNENIEYENNRYVVHLPWINEKRDKLVNNYELASKRADNLKKRLSKNPSLEERYNNVLLDLEQRGIVHEVPSEEIVNENPTFYVPHRPIIREASATTKIRPVFDCSAKGSNGISLNDCLETGPNLIPNLVEVMIRFRRWKYGLTADIEKAFLQIKVTKRDQDVHRFIWDVRGQRRIMRFDRVIFGNVSSPFLLNATVKNHLNNFQTSRVVSELEENLYVDDWLSGADTEEEVAHMITSASEIMGKGSFPLSKWGSNSSSVMPQKAVKGFDLDDNEGIGVTEIPPSLKILGMCWETEEDVFYFKSDPVMINDMQYTKRLVLSFIARIYDPMGFLSPFTVMIKIMFQDLWRLGLNWDDPLPNEHQKQMTLWANGFRDVNEWKIPRCISVLSWEGGIYKHLLCFSDASERAYGGCVYLRICENGVEKVSLVISRVRVAPLKKITLPRLELLGALLTARLLCFVKNALNLPYEIPCSCFTDSTIALHWIKADPQRWKLFVRNRVIEIQSLTSPSNWKHISGKDNPADLLTRGVSATELTNSAEWLQGPKNLESLDSNHNVNELFDEQDIYSERVRTKDIHALVNVQSQFVEGPIIDFNFKRFSYFPKVIKVMGWILRFIGNLKLKCTSKKIQNKAPLLQSPELNIARIWVMKLAQREKFLEEVNCLTLGKNVVKSSPLFKLAPFLDENGLLRVGGRLQMSTDFSFEEKHPIILPKGHVALLLVRFQHLLLKHAGVHSLLSSLRSNYWIFGLRTLAKSVCRLCVPCQRQDSRACSQIMAPLPSDRIERSHPFSVTGLDHAGPLYCQDTGAKKYYILLFTCGVTRAVHLELVASLSLAEFLLAFRRFVARRGMPAVIYSDNAKTFEAASGLVGQFGPVAPTWKFSIPLAPWYGGWWERLVRSTKSALRKSLGRELVTKSELETILLEIEACVNSRPLTHVGEQGEPLTPSHFLLSRSSPFNNVPAGSIPQNKEEFSNLLNEHRAILEKFWQYWSEEYIRNLPSLGNGKSKVDLQVGTVVLIREEGKSRLKWPMGKISGLILSKDGLIRAVSIKTEKGELVRPVQKLHKLEVSDECLENPGSQVSTEAKTSEGISISRSGRIIKTPKVLDL